MKLEETDATSMSAIRSIIPRTQSESNGNRSGKFVLPSINGTLSGEDAIKMMLERTSLKNNRQDPTPNSTVYTTRQYTATSRPATRAGVPPASKGDMSIRHLLDNGRTSRDNLASNDNRDHNIMGQIRALGVAIDPLLGGGENENWSYDLDRVDHEKLGIQWKQIVLHARRYTHGWCEKHSHGQHDCPRCLMRRLLPRTTQTKRVGGGYVCLGENQDTDGEHDGHGSWRLLPDGSYLLPDGSRLLPDGTRILPDGRRILPDGTVLDADGNVIGFMDADGNFTKGKKLEDGSILLDDGSRLLADGTRVLPDGTRILPDGTRILPDGTRILPDGTRILPDGRRVLPDGTILDADGNVVGYMDANGNIIGGKRLADGSILLEDGSRVLADGTRVLPDGTRILKDGTRILPDGTRILPDGTRILPDGTRILPDGTRILPDGTRILPDGDETKRRRKKANGDDANGGNEKLDQATTDFLETLTDWIVDKHDGKMPTNFSMEFFDNFPEHLPTLAKYEPRPKGESKASKNWAKVKAGVTGDTDFGHVVDFIMKRDAAMKRITTMHRRMFTYEPKQHTSSDDDDDSNDATAGDSKGGVEEVEQEYEEYEEYMEEVDPNAAPSSSSSPEPNVVVDEVTGKAMVKKVRKVKKMRVVRKASSNETDGEAQQIAKAVSKASVGQICVSAEALAASRARKKLRGRYKDGDETDRKGRGRKMRGLQKSTNTNKKKGNGDMVFVKDLNGMNALDYLSKYCILSDEQLLKYRKVFKNIDVNRDGLISQNELSFGLRTVNNSMISVAELDYVDAVLEVRLKKEIDFRMFAVIAALSEKVNSLDRLVKGMVNKMDAYAMQKKMMGCKQMFYLLDEHKDGMVEMDMLVREVRAGRITQEHEDIILAKFSEDGKVYVDFLDFLTYIPLFMEIHDTINDNPLKTKREK